MPARRPVRCSLGIDKEPRSGWVVHDGDGKVAGPFRSELRARQEAYRVAKQRGVARSAVCTEGVPSEAWVSPSAAYGIGERRAAQCRELRRAGFLSPWCEE